MERVQLQPGDLIFGEYEVLDLAGVGATSHVYRCTSERFGGQVAVKVLHDDLVGHPRHRRRFLREAHLMRGMEHPSIVKVLDIISTPTVLAYVMEHVEGLSLKEWLQDRAAGMDPMVMVLFLDVLAGLAHAHERGIVHRDLKPGNILVEMTPSRPRGRIIDFGVARLVRLPPEPDDFNSIRGTAAYISPDEIRSPLEVCPQSDLYSLGVILYEATAGVRPFEGRPGKALLCAHLNESPPSPALHTATISPGVESLIMTLLSKSPDDRVPSAQALGDALREALDDPDFGAALEALSADEDTPIEWVAALQLILVNILTALLSPGLTGRADDPHYLNRPPMMI
mgnify:CR=1 FL=1